jgi:hypothetical protein
MLTVKLTNHDSLIVTPPPAQLYFSDVPTDSIKIQTSHLGQTSGFICQMSLVDQRGN